MRLMVLLLVGCASPSKVRELEAAYDAAIAQRDRAMAERDAAMDRGQAREARQRRRLEAFATVYEVLREVQAERLAVLRIEDGRAVLQLAVEGLFEPRSARLTDEGQAKIAAIARKLAPLQNHLQVEGHTDDKPVRSREFPTVWHLGSDRAIVVVEHLVEGGLPSGRVSAATFGASRAQQGRIGHRIEIVILPSLERLLPYTSMVEQLESAR